LIPIPLVVGDRDWLLATLTKIGDDAAASTIPVVSAAGQSLERAVIDANAARMTDAEASASLSSLDQLLALVTACRTAGYP
jgi:hypothetical protein